MSVHIQVSAFCHNLCILYWRSKISDFFVDKFYWMIISCMCPCKENMPIFFTFVTKVPHLIATKWDNFWYRKWIEREGKMRKCREWISLHSLFIFSFSLHFLAARLPGCNKLCNPALHTTNELLWNQEVCCAQQNSIGFRSLYWLLFLSIALSLGHVGRGQCRMKIYMKNTCNAYFSN